VCSSDLEIEGKTAMLIAADGVFRGIVAVADTIKDTAIEAMKILHENNMELVMLTGDNERTAQAIARQVGIDRVIAEVLPEQKAEKSQELQAEGKNDDIVSDGI